MPNKKISALNVNTTPLLGDVFPIVDNGVTKKLSLSGLTDFLRVNLTDIYVTGGTYSIVTNSIRFTNNSGGTFSVSGITGGGGGGGAEVITLSKTDLDGLIAISGLTGGTFYIVQGVDTRLYGGTDIMIQAISSTKLNTSGVGLFYNPKYNQSVNGFGIWDNKNLMTFTNVSDEFTVNENIIGNGGQQGQIIGIPSLLSQQLQFIATAGDWSTATSFTGLSSNSTASIITIDLAQYNIDEIVIYGGKHWVNLNGNVGATDGSLFGLNSEWAFIPYDSVNYNLVSDKIEYDYNNDIITYREDIFNNSVRTDYDGSYNWWGDNIIKYFPWGNGCDYINRHRGFASCIFNNSVIPDLINFRGYYVFNLKMAPYTYCGNIKWSIGCYLTNVTLNGAHIINENTRSFNDITFGRDSYIVDALLGQNVTFDTITLGDNSSLSDLNLNSSATIYNIVLGEDSIIEKLSMNINSTLASIIFGVGSILNKIKLDLGASIVNSRFNDGIGFRSSSIGIDLLIDGYTFSENKNNIIIDINNNTFPVNLNISNLTQIDLSNINHAGIVTLRTTTSNVNYSLLNGNFFKIGDTIVDLTTAASGITTNNIQNNIVITGETIGVGDGVSYIFPFSLSNVLLSASTLVVTDTVEIFTDNGNGILSGNLGGSGNINYVLGTGSISFLNSPLSGQNITANYSYITGGTLTIDTIDRNLIYVPFDYITNNNGANATVVSYVGPSSSENINSISNINSNYPIKFVPENGLTVVFSGTSISAATTNCIVMPSQYFTLIGTYGDYFIVNKKNSYVQQIDAQNFL